jgi:hypothetical protein
MTLKAIWNSRGESPSDFLRLSCVAEGITEEGRAPNNDVDHRACSLGWGMRWNLVMWQMASE